MGLSDEQLEHLVHAAQTGRNINNVTHDINNSLGAIMAYADLMHMDSSDEETKKMLENIMACAKSSSELLEKLTTISRTAKRDTQRPCSVVEALEAISSLFAYEIKLMRIEYTVEGAEDCPRVDVSLPILQRILMHLMANAVECEREGERRSITVKVASDENALRISITNAGLRGIEFDVAQWSTPGFSTKDGHAGMGLSVANTLTESIGGTLSYEAELGWTLSIPIDH